MCQAVKLNGMSLTAGSPLGNEPLSNMVCSLSLREARLIPDEFDRQSDYGDKGEF